ncbi:hemerythrin domain-containing protein [Marinobacterium sediminicola]|uniref:Hemerythrin-like domain-containing protein n=1 Tax=Marinobacterium sediminicola TaxID=518898 RepID=A0ABY1RWW4_9GAMM|nr:hemerythrin domain-containing protein [Marinobacterium sediminicola]ULG67957.1 hemerythrin domain-containing protein [Marinobacterium sediminicola]SMR71308.1 Hemerythrin-like domain-containing protein [Marinobacterium sediminicola]
MDILSELHQDHVNLSRLLEILDRKVDRLRAGNHPDFSLMAEVVSYVGSYADQHHHPREDKMYAFFQGRDDELDKALSRCEEEHKQLKQLSTHLEESIDGILNDVVMPMDRFTDQLDEFVQAEKRHLDFEEQEIFRLLRSHASEADWQQLDQQLPRSEDPLFGEKQADEYRALYKALMEDMNRTDSAG